MSRIGVISDTHGHVARVDQAVRLFEQQQLEAVLHCGDIGSLEIPPLFRSLPTHFVLGNVDWNTDALAESIEAIGHTLHGRFGTLKLGSRSIALLHGDETRRLQSVIQSGEWEVVCCGHSHRADCHRVGKTLVLNPGALHRALRYTVAVLDLTDLSVAMFELD
jgi:putative phosphoesterase